MGPASFFPHRSFKKANSNLLKLEKPQKKEGRVLENSPQTETDSAVSLD
jgi:hypothetical protein